MKKPKIKVKIQVIKIKRTDPSIEVFHINVIKASGGKGKPGSEWPETYGSTRDAEIFMKGLKVGFSMLERPDIELPPIPVKEF